MPVLCPSNRYSNRLNRALNFAHAHSHHPVSLDILARKACLSKYHFTRIFHECVGESPIQFAKRTRLEKTASLLKSEPHRAVADIGHHCGYSSPQSFTREFGLRFGTSPARYRQQHWQNQEERRGVRTTRLLFDQFDRIGIDFDLERSASKIQATRLPNQRVAYIRNLGRYGGCDGIEQAMHGIRDWAIIKAIATHDTPLIGISWDFSSMTPKNLCRYDACIEIPSDWPEPVDVSSQWIPGGDFAIAEMPYCHPGELPVLWKWFSLALILSPKFKRFEIDRSVGPWYETYLGTAEQPRIRMQMRIHRRQC